MDQGSAAADCRRWLPAILPVHNYPRAFFWGFHFFTEFCEGVGLEIREETFAFAFRLEQQCTPDTLHSYRRRWGGS